MAMSATLRNKIVTVIGGGAFAIATVMLSGKGGLEGREYVAYRDVASILTVCDGHTGSDIIQGRRYTDKECDAMTKRDLQAIASQVDPHIKVPISEMQRASIYSFSYNVGAKAFINSMLLKKLNAGDYDGACAEMLRWVYAGGKKWEGLMNRRDVEYEVCTWGMK